MINHPQNRSGSRDFCPPAEADLGQAGSWPVASPPNAAAVAIKVRTCPTNVIIKRSPALLRLQLLIFSFIGLKTPLSARTILNNSMKTAVEHLQLLLPFVLANLFAKWLCVTSPPSPIVSQYLASRYSWIYLVNGYTWIYLYLIGQWIYLADKYSCNYVSILSL